MVQQEKYAQMPSEIYQVLYSSSSITITSPGCELDPASFTPDSALARFPCLPESSCGSPRFRLRSPAADDDDDDDDDDDSIFEFSSLSDSMIIVSFGVSATLGVDVCEVWSDDVRSLDRDWMGSNIRWGASTGMVNIREDGPVGPRPRLDGGGEVDGGETPGRAYSSVQCLAVLSCCFLFLMYSVAIDGTTGPVTNYVSEIYRGGRGYELSALPSGSSKNGVAGVGTSVRN